MKKIYTDNKNDEKAKNNMINSIVNTLTELTEVNKVKILINGNQREEFKEIYTLTYNPEDEEWEKNIIGTYDENTRTVSMNIENLGLKEVS